MRFESAILKCSAILERGIMLEKSSFGRKNKISKLFHEFLMRDKTNTFLTKLILFKWCHDTPHNDTQHNDTQHKRIFVTLHKNAA